MPPPSLLASLPLIVLLPRFSVPPLRIPPPLLSLPLAELPANVLLRIVIVPLLKIAPPPNPPPELPVMVQLVTVAVPRSEERRVGKECRARWRAEQEKQR